MSAAEERLTVLKDVALNVGQAWAEAWREDLRREGRAVEGGWPGTLPEARGRVAAFAGRELVRRGWAILTTDELRWLSRATYERARRVWLAMPVRVSREREGGPKRAAAARPRVARPR